MKDAKGHGSDSRGGVSGQATAVKGLVNMIRPPAAHQEGIRQGVPMSDDERAQKIADWRDKGTSDAQVREGIRAMFNLPSGERVR